MQSDDSHQKYGIRLFKRRLSFKESEQHQRHRTQRQQLKQKYQQFLQSRRKSIEEYPFSPQSSSISKNEQIIGSMPSIRKFREQKHKIGQALRQTISKYNYINHQKQKQVQNLNRKKMKYQKVLKIRQDHIKQKMSLNQSRVLLEKQIQQQKLRLKKTVDFDRTVMGHSRIQNLLQKKSLGDQRRQQGHKNKSEIHLNNAKDYVYRKQLHESIIQQQRSLKKKKISVQEQRKRMGVDHYYQKLYKQLDKIQNLQKKQQTARSKYSQKISQLQRSKQILDDKMKNYQQILKDGSTLRKIRPKLKINSVSGMKTSQLTSNRIKTESNSDDIFY